MRNCKTLTVTSQLLVHAARHGVDKCIVTRNPLPDDARILAATMASNQRDVLFLIGSSTYPEIQGFTEYPEMDSPEFTRITAPERQAVSCMLTREDITTLLYDVDRAVGRKLAFTIKADGSFEASTIVDGEKL